MALHRNKFRLDEVSVLDCYRRSYGSPTSLQSLPYARKHHCVEPTLSTGSPDWDCGPKTLSRTSVVVDYNNASLSLWTEGPQTSWTPWNTFTELGSHHQFHLEHQYGGSDQHWDQVAQKIMILADHSSPSDRNAVDFVYTGESWDEGGWRL